MQSQSLTAKRFDTKRLVILSMFAAIAFIVALLKIKVFTPYLSFEFKSTIIAIAGFIFGPSAVIFISIPVCFLEIFTGDTGLIGAFMNIIATVSFALPAALMYKKKRTLSSAVIGLIFGTAALTTLMLLWNYIITPIYTGMPRETIAGMLLPVFAPFNILKGSLNASLAFLLYNPLINGLRSARLIPPTEKKEEAISQKSAVMANIIAGVIMLAGVIVLIVFKK